MFLCVFCACIRFYINVNLKNNISKVKCALGHPMPPFRPTHSDYAGHLHTHAFILTSVAVKIFHCAKQSAVDGSKSRVCFSSCWSKFSRWFDNCGSYGNAFFIIELLNE